ncbi:ABC-F family ATP-binding cassette domain-containing protein [Aeromonas hydrophila]|uniref:ATP-binding cassette domain-containing protein n=1 Tax=Aeromonas hydrophila TaxID=644 RepID=UPI001B3A78A4|nr:ATP-binding cassette domain-containing protein [Aeromonas hydrophila]MBQ4677828.1 ATP-binding cassette domain-containing protein [Aeromonas hydrophila]MBW3814970.1 ATP-binding cassette domain-containing protein [Aeromonas hydrophila]MCF7677520.1 ABC-F family ATP-binding cassette domain-containing protein [Aeromonas hydrophila]MCF7690323.1 ABC-F family ATP-binding cassette domain-containing protein [Aeromonas hydrophila]MCF7775553.1 ABC-F family ATP-binding cassette domain-containing protein
MTHIACHINALQLPFGACTVPLTFTLPAAGCTLIGRNGIGKSLLLELLAGQRRAASGKIEWLTPISWLSQFAPVQAHDDAASVADVIGWGEPLRALERIEQGSCALDDFELLADRWNLRSDLADLLAEAGLRLDAHAPVSTLSGGQLTRLRLLALFARSAHFLLLDEPDNHLDASGIAWLSQRLASHSGGYLLVSHDRRLLNQASQILELGEQGLQSASLSFEAFLAQQAELQAARSARLAQTERREKAAARSVQKVRAEAAAALAAVQPLVMQWPAESDRKGAAQPLVITAARHRRWHGQQVDLVLPRGARCLLAGRNGSGKSSLLQMLRGELAPEAGSFRINGWLACLDQGLSLIARDLSPLANLLAAAPTLCESDARTRLAGIALRGDRALVSCHGLSGGERLKLGLLMVLAQQPDLLLLDEPDNHLDHPSRQLLTQVLADYPGTLLLVSHDPDFVAGVGIEREYWLEGETLAVKSV